MNNEKTTVAELLKSARVERGLSIKDIAADICVRSSYLTAIEEADYDQLPGKTFAIGFVKAYAAALGVNAATIIEDFKKEYCPETANLEAAPVIKATKPERKIPGWLAPVTGIAGVTACWMLLGGSVATNFMWTTASVDDVAREEAQLAAVQANLPEPSGQTAANIEAAEPVVLASAPAVDNAVVAEAEPAMQSRSFFTPAVYADGAESRSVAGNYVLEAVEDSWVRIAHADGTEMWSGILREGQSYRPQADGVILLSTSNAGGVLLTVAGGEAAVLGARGTIVSDMKLEDMTLLSEQEAGELSEFGSD